MYMVMFVLDDPNLLDPVLDAWEEIGVSGATIAETTGINRRRTQKKWIPTRFAVGQFVEGEQQNHYTLFTIVRSEDIVRKCLAAVEEVVGDLDLPNTGVLAAWPLTLIKGIPAESLGGEEK